jgi:hypothetical protein
LIGPIRGGATIVPRSLQTKGNKKISRQAKFFLFFKSLMNFIFAKDSFSKIQSMNSDRDGFMGQYWAKMSKFIKLSLRLSGTEISLVSDKAEPSLA